MNKRDELPVSLTGYYPLEDLTSRLISLRGMQHILNDRNLAEGTIELLKKTEAGFFRKEAYKDYKFLLEDHDAKAVYIKSFREHNSIGKTHLSMLISENRSQTYAELVAAYCIDKRIPFLAALLILEDYRKTCGSLTMYVKNGGAICEVAWHPPQSNTPPPVNYRKMLNANVRSRPDTDDDYVLATLKDMCFNKILTAKALRISEYLLKTRLTELKVIREDGTIDKILVDSLLEKRVKFITPDKSPAAVTGTVTIAPAHAAPPKKKGERDVDTPCIITEEDILYAYRKHRDVRKVSEELGIPYINVLSAAQKLTKQVYDSEYTSSLAEEESCKLCIESKKPEN